MTAMICYDYEFAEGVLGLVLVGAEGVVETEDLDWIRRATDEEQAAFEHECRRRIADEDGDAKAMAWSLSDWAVDNNNRPYWLMAILDTPDTPEPARRFAEVQIRRLRVHVDY